MLELYKDLIMDHGNNPRNNYVMENHTHFSRGYNYLCGDKCEIYLNIKNNLIDNVSFSGVGCIISIASASIMSINLEKKNIHDSIILFKYFINIVTGKVKIKDDFEDINILSNVKKFPNRVKCATLIWHTFNSAVKETDNDFNF